MKQICKRHTIFFLGCALFFLLSHISCTAPIDIDTDNSAPVIVIYGTITDELKKQEVRVSSSAPYFDQQQNPSISGAVVKIESSLNQVYTLQENDSIKGLYQTETPFAGLAGVSYKLSVAFDFDRDGKAEIYEASTVLQPAVQLDSISVVKFTTMGHSLYALNLYGQDSPEEDFYLLKYAINDSLISTKISKYELSDDNLLNGQYINGRTMRYFESIENIDDYAEADRQNVDFLSPGDTVTMFMSKIEKGYSDFIDQSQKEMRGENPFFGGPASNITTNISNGGVGYFSGYSIASKSAVAP